MATRKTSTKPGPAPKRRPAKPKAKVSRRAAPSGGGMSVREAGRLGGLLGGRKGGLAVKAGRGVAFFQEIGRLGGQRVRELIAAGRKAMERPVRRRHT